MLRSSSSKLLNPVTYIKGVGPSRADLLLKEKGIKTQWDMLLDFPFRHIDRTRFGTVKDAADDGFPVQLKGVVTHAKIAGTGRGKRLTANFTDGTGSLSLVWFQGVHRIDKMITPGIKIVIFGKISFYSGKKTMAHPEMEIIEEGTIPPSQRVGLQPVYSTTEKLSSRGLDARGLRRILKNICSQLTERDIRETLPEYLLNKLKLIGRYQAFMWIHFPQNQVQLKAARKRLAFEELFVLQLRMLFRMSARKMQLKGFKFDQVGQYFRDYFSKELPFELTRAQKRVIKEIRSDTRTGIQMNRLVQGDVGSGKTIVSIMAMLLAIDNGFQACMMAPTEILATQHYLKISEQLERIGLKAAFLSGNVKSKKRKEVLENLREGNIHVLIGTHALIEDWVVFHKLGLVVIDEQHRFGVQQRAKLWKKSGNLPPHIMVMTATPIPRTLAMTLYGDLDISIIDELPPGRKPVKTTQTTDRYRGRLNNFLKSEIAKGRQVYIVYPLIEESSKLDLANLQQGYEDLLGQFPRPQYQIGVVHGKLKAEDKDMEMKKFVEGRTNILVSTTVIEVGVNVPNASVMVIENAERFGLSQLHQLRGRVGRGADQSHCILVAGYKLTKVARKRMEIMCSTNDGFVIAEEDLKIRGPGEIEGTRQSGDIELKVANMAQDGLILQTARKLGKKILEKDPTLSHPVNELLKKIVESDSASRLLGRIG
jgi:ATP-dependent DNA helicase RecG